MKYTKKTLEKLASNPHFKLSPELLRQLEEYRGVKQTVRPENLNTQEVRRADTFVTAPQIKKERQYERDNKNIS